jgi:hypothetical protein
MIDKNLKLEQIIFENIIQSTIDIYTHDDNQNVVLIKSGKLLNFNIKLPFLYFVMEYKNKTREFPLPQPFVFKWDGEKIIMSYEIKNMGTDEKVLDRMKKLGYDSESKIFDKRVYVKPIV